MSGPPFKLPLRADDHYPGRLQIEDLVSAYVAECVTPEQRTYIIAAVNQHEALVAEVARLREAGKDLLEVNTLLLMFRGGNCTSREKIAMDTMAAALRASEPKE